MAFTGLNVLHGTIITIGNNTDVFGEAVWSEELLVPSTGTKVATERPNTDFSRPQAAFLIQAAVNAKVYVGPNPAAADTPMYRIYAGTSLVIPVDKGDKVRWVVA